MRPGVAKVVTRAELEEDGLASGLLLDIGSEALQELGVLPLGHRPQDGRWGPPTWVNWRRRGGSHDLTRTSTDPQVKLTLTDP